MNQNPKIGLELLLSILDRLEIAYAIAGSVASSVHGHPRSTADIDLVADIRADHVSELIRLTRDSFYSDEETIHDALRRGRSFNLIHQPTAFKFDVFPTGDDPFSIAGLERQACGIISAEDIILSKLRCYPLSGGSERQWDDMVGVVQRKRDKLDYEYLQEGARRLNASDLLRRLLDSSGRRALS